MSRYAATALSVGRSCPVTLSGGKDNTSLPLAAQAQVSQPSPGNYCRDGGKLSYWSPKGMTTYSRHGTSESTRESRNGRHPRASLTAENVTHMSCFGPTMARQSNKPERSNTESLVTASTTFSYMSGIGVLTSMSCITHRKRSSLSLRLWTYWNRVGLTAYPFGRTLNVPPGFLWRATQILVTPSSFGHRRLMTSGV